MLFYNNSSYGNKWGIILNGGHVGSMVKNNLVKNNVFLENTSNELAAYGGGENDGTKGSGNVYTYNCLGIEAANFIWWGDGPVYKSTYDAWETSYGSTTNSVEADPLFTNAAGDDFSIKRGPADIGAVYIPGFTTKLRPETCANYDPSNVATMGDILSLGACGIYRGAAGM